MLRNCEKIISRHSCSKRRGPEANGTNQTHAIVQSRRLTLFEHIVRMDDNADAKRILSSFLPEDWRRPRGRPRITWLSTIQQDPRSHNLTLPEAMDMAQNRSLWRMWSTYGHRASSRAHLDVVLCQLCSQVCTAVVQVRVRLVQVCVHFSVTGG